jgi:hypothetical protein
MFELWHAQEITHLKSFFMKRNISILIILIAGLFIMACKEGHKQQIAQAGVQSSKDYDSAGGQIPIEYADGIVKQYQDKFKGKLERSGDPEIKNQQTDHIWIPIERLEGFIKVLKNESEKKEGRKLSGIRLYYAAYKNETDPQTSRCSRQITLVGCGTYLDKGIHCDLIDASKSRTFTGLKMGYENHGHLCPPEADEYCKGTGLGHNP